MAFRHLLVPMDFSEPANHALRHAAEEADLHRAKVTLLHSATNGRWHGRLLCLARAGFRSRDRR
jgi:nucleotide-binding universal stress UspA family protein